jgi:hypothetical protein
MSRATAFCLMVLSTSVLAAQSAVSSDPSSGPPCRNVVTVYVDFSETITGRAGHDEAAPLHTMVRALRNLLTTGGKLLRDGDALSIVAFGNGAVELLRVDVMNDQSRARLDRELMHFTGSEWRTSSLVRDKIEDLGAFSVTTRLDSVLDSIGGQIEKSGSQDRHLILIASDFAHDDDNSCVSADHIGKFAGRFDLFAKKHRDAFVGSVIQSPIAQTMLLSVPAAVRRRCGAADTVVAADVLRRWAVLEPHRVEDLQRFSAEELEEEIDERFSSAVRIENARKTAKTEITFKVVNPNCTEVTVRAVTLQASNAVPVEIPLQRQIRLSRSKPSEEITVTSPALSDLANQIVKIAPVVGRFRTRAADFWMGDTIRLGNVTPRLYPRLGPSGRMLLVVETNIDLGSVTDVKLHVVDVPATQDGDWTNEISFSPSTDGSQQTYVVPFTAPSEVLERIRKMPALTLRVDQPTGGGARVVTSLPESNEHKTKKPFVGLDGLFNTFFPVISGAIGLIVLIWSRRYHDPKVSVALAADVAGLTFFTLAFISGAIMFLSWAIVFLGVDGWPILARLFSIESSHVWIPTLGEAGAVAVLTLSISRTYVLAIQWPRMMLSGLSVEEALPRRIKAEKAIVVFSSCMFIMTLILLLYALPATGIMVMRKAT